MKTDLVVALEVSEARANTQGGAGRGGGRKCMDGATGTKRRCVSIDDASADVLRGLGDGDLSLGIRRAAAQIKAQPTPQQS
jgi:hypothetical protein